MTTNNFIIFTDSQGKMPVLSHTLDVNEMPLPSHCYFVRYINNRPAVVNPFPGQERVWDYSQNRYIPVSSVPTIYPAGCQFAIMVLGGIFGIKGEWVASAKTYQNARLTAMLLSVEDPIHAYAIEPRS